MCGECVVSWFVGYVVFGLLFCFVVSSDGKLGIQVLVAAMFLKLQVSYHLTGSEWAIVVHTSLSTEPMTINPHMCRLCFCFEL